MNDKYCVPFLNDNLTLKDYITSSEQGSSTNAPHIILRKRHLCVHEQSCTRTRAQTRSAAAARPRSHRTCKVRWRCSRRSWRPRMQARAHPANLVRIFRFLWWRTRSCATRSRIFRLACRARRCFCRSFWLFAGCRVRRGLGAPKAEHPERRTQSGGPELPRTRSLRLMAMLYDFARCLYPRVVAEVKDPSSKAKTQIPKWKTRATSHFLILVLLI